MKTLSLDDLNNVTGGKNQGTSLNVGGGNNDQLLSTLTNIQSSLKDLSNNQSGGLFGGQNGLMFMTMALAMSQRQSNVVVCGGGCRRGFSWRAW